MGKTIPLQDQSNILSRKINFQMTLRKQRPLFLPFRETEALEEKIHPLHPRKAVAVRVERSRCKHDARIQGQ